MAEHTSPPAPDPTWQLLRPVRARLAWSLACSAAATLASLAAIACLALVFLRSTGTSDRPWTAMALLAALICAACLLRVGAFHLSHLAAFRLEHHLRTCLCAKLARLPLGQIEAMGTGRLTQLIMDDVRDLHAFVADSLPIYPRVYLAPVLVLGALLYLDWRLALAASAVLAAVAWYLRRIRGQHAALGMQYGRAREALNAAIMAFIQAMPVVRLFDSGQGTFSRYQQALDTFSAFVAQWYRQVAGTGNVLMALLNPLLTLVLLLWLGAWLYLEDSLDAAAWVCILLLSSVLSEIILPLLFLQSTRQKIAAPVRRILAFSQLPEPRQPDPATARTPRDGSIRFERVSFRYQPGGEPVLHDLSFTLPAGKLTALVGASGAGKSTVARLIPRFWDADQGRVLVGGQDVRDLPAQVLMAHVGFVFQDAFLFSASISENIRMGRHDATQADIEAAARSAMAHDFITALPDGYATQAGERGQRLSGGQRQRIQIARAILHAAPVLVLDEPTSHADPLQADAMMASLAPLMHGRTVLLVAHRLSMLRHADQILVLDQGRLVQAGTHDSLVCVPGRYAELWRQGQAAAAWQPALSPGHAP